MKNPTLTGRGGAPGEALTKAVAGNLIQKHELTRAPTPQASQDEQASSREEAIRTAAYLRAERRGFEHGYDIEDWLAAERDVAEREGAGTLG